MYKRFFKRMFDFILALIGVILASPFELIACVLILVIDKMNPIFKQARVGKGEKVFYIYKLQTMKKDENGVNQVTKLGKILRATSIDELPQLLNILKGEMSFIGPRPVVDGEIEKYGINKQKFLSVKPGLTGYWQANGRSNTTYAERMDMELYYVDNQSLWLDIKIFFKTFISVLKKEGAM